MTNTAPLREWAPLVELANKIPASVSRGLLFHDVSLTCVAAVEHFIALGTNVGLVFWYNRRTGAIERLATEGGSPELRCVRIISSVEYMVAVGCRAGMVNIFQIPKAPPPDVCAELLLKAKPIERYTVGGLHRAPITELLWSKNGMKLFSGDALGAVVLTEMEYSSKTCQSREIINERYEIVQMDLRPGQLLVSSSFRTVICQPEDGGTQRWRVAQVGKKDRKMLAPFGAIFAPKQQIVATRSGFRLWLADFEGNVAQTLIFKEQMRDTNSEISLLNPSRNPIRIPTTFGKLYPFEAHQMVTVANGALFLLDLERVAIVGTLTRLRQIVDVAVDRNEILILESSRSLVRVATLPDTSHTTVVFKNLELFASAESQVVVADECREETTECTRAGSQSTGPQDAEERAPPVAIAVVSGSSVADQPDGEARLINVHMKKLELFDTLNELKYDDSILFKSGRRSRKHRAKVNPIVEIGQIPKEIETDDEATAS
ncbi:WD repeat-containing protein CG11141 [Anopheles bellator]|uniref:WD repeat-containing protein CG11141 n=1 Tax=Anopheles bellator TaxID=139047 RepID=UPI0026483325|nr:WD repeat-containing protein CG11141 [Anopheles bellator]